MIVVNQQANRYHHPYSKTRTGWAQILGSSLCFNKVTLKNT